MHASKKTVAKVVSEPPLYKEQATTSWRVAATGCDREDWYAQQLFSSLTESIRAARLQLGTNTKTATQRHRSRPERARLRAWAVPRVHFWFSR
jgi:hypothetical protein